MKREIHIMRWVVWSLAALFYLYEYFLRVSPSVMTSELISSFGVNAAAIGVLSAFYFYTYSPMQIPVGLLMDRFGARKLLTFSTFICGVGSLLFAIAPGIWLADMGRLLIGIGASFAFVGLIYVSSVWFPAKHTALLIALGNSFGMLGAIGGEDVLSFMVNFIGWRAAMSILAFIGLLLSLITYMAMKREPKGMHKHGPPKQTTKGVIRNLKEVARNKNSWINGIISLMFYSTMTAFASLWAIPFIVEYYGISKETASFAVSMNFIGWLVGGPLIGYFSDKIASRRYFILAAAFLSLLIIGSIIYLPPLPLPLLFFVFFLIGLTSSAQLLTFTIAIEINDPKARGISASFTNFLISAGGTFIAPLIGYLIDTYWSGQMRDGIPFYSTADYRFGFIVFPICLLITMVLALFLNEKKFRA